MTVENLQGESVAPAEIAGVLTPVPGGVGPLRLSVLLRNVVACVRAGR